MKKVERVKLELSFSKYNELKGYFRKENNLSSSISLMGKFTNGFSVEVNIYPKSFSYGRYNEADVSIKLYDNSNRVVGDTSMVMDRISKLNSIFRLHYQDITYLVSIDKKVELTKKTAISRINIVKWNALDFDYVENLVLFNNFNNEMELLETIFCVYTGALELIREDEFTELKNLLIEKLDYYGISEDDISADYDYDDYVYEANNSSELLSDFALNLLFELTNPNYAKNCVDTDDLKTFAYEKVESFFNLLVSEGKLSEY